MGKLRLGRFGGSCWRLCSCVPGSEMSASIPRLRSLHLLAGVGSDSQFSSDCKASARQGFAFKAGSWNLKSCFFGMREWDRSTCPNTSFLAHLNRTWNSHWEAACCLSPFPGSWIMSGGEGIRKAQPSGGDFASGKGYCCRNRVVRREAQTSWAGKCT